MSFFILLEVRKCHLLQHEGYCSEGCGGSAEHGPKHIVVLPALIACGEDRADGGEAHGHHSGHLHRHIASAQKQHGEAHREGHTSLVHQRERQRREIRLRHQTGDVVNDIGHPGQDKVLPDAQLAPFFPATQYNLELLGHRSSPRCFQGEASAVEDQIHDSIEDAANQAVVLAKHDGGNTPSEIVQRAEDGHGRHEDRHQRGMLKPCHPACNGCTLKPLTWACPTRGFCKA
mmetsp:Transcript_87107/g.244358  ORF Transcript_87107/g.244358 Transcript_87107/m.244358 type:complete len:231 (-) Transcript_87107:2-694(-)